MSTATIVNWPDVMAGLTGLRLAIHDELLRCGSMDQATIARHVGNASGIAALKDAVEWLATHRFLVVEDGIWRAVMPPLARVQVEMSGLANVGEMTAAPAPEVSRPRGQTATVQKHQVEFFTLDGYRDSDGSRD